MKRTSTVVALLLFTGVPSAFAQVTGTPSFNSPHRSFARMEFGGTLSFLNSTTGIEGVYRFGQGNLDVGIKAGGLFVDLGVLGSSETFVIGAEVRGRVLTSSADFPMDGAVITGLGAMFASGAKNFNIPIGLSLGKKIDLNNSNVNITPFAQPTMIFQFGDSPSSTTFAFGVGVDLELSPTFDLRISGGISDLEGISIGAVWTN